MIKHKFKAKPTVYDGIKYGSKKEANYAFKLDLAKKSGELLFYLRQVPFDLPGGFKHRIDFLEFWADGTAKFVEVKGMDLPMGKLKRKRANADES